MIVFTVFYIPVGLYIVGDWLKSKSPTNNTTSKEKRASWFWVLLLIGIGICLPKLLRPIRVEKQGYRDAAKWLRENTAPKDMIAIPDSRIAFYAERKGLGYGKKVPKQAKYAVRMVKDENKKPEFGKTVQEMYSVWANKREKKKRIVIYEVL